MSYKLINLNDPNDQIDLYSEDEVEALYEGLETVGWLLVESDDSSTEN